MGKAVEGVLGNHLAGGLMVTKYGHGLPLRRLDLLEAGHPLPDANSLASAEQISYLAEHLVKPEDLVICLLSGGASSLLVAPVPGITLRDKLVCTRLLLNGGATIKELNAVRKHLSAIKGGGLARILAPARVESIILSDVVGDDLATIASGPLSPDPTTFGDCCEILKKLGILERIPPAIRKRFQQGAGGRIQDTPKEGNPIFRRVNNTIVGSNAQACSAAAGEARKLGYNVMVLTSRLEGDTGEAARFHMSIACEVADRNRPLRRPACILSGGETTVRVTGDGRGGRNQEFVLHCVRSLANLQICCAVASLGTDGTDGPTNAAGAIADNATLARSIKHGSRFLSRSLENNDSYSFFKRLGDLIVTGPTRTNVMDIHIMLIGNDTVP
jgi:hydroxypyruvate reductase